MKIKKKLLVQGKQTVGKINHLKSMKREILVEIWLKSTDGDCKESKNQKQVFKWHSKGEMMHKS